MEKDKIFGGIFGLIVGDALGVPVEFQSRDFLKKYPINDMIGYGTHNVPPGTWSDDSSLTLCLVDSLINGFDLNDIADKFVKWYDFGLWTSFGKVFDIGNTTKLAIYNLKNGISPEKAGPSGERDNGNGSLMRILPIAFYVKNLPLEEQFKITHKVSAITHGHIRSQIACGIFIQLVLQLLDGNPAKIAYNKAKEISLSFYSKKPFLKELKHFERILKKDISRFEENDIESTGYVVHSLEASIWCFLNSASFKESVLKAVNLGNDTDTIGAITGGVAGVYFGYKNIPEKWLKNLAKFKDIYYLLEKFSNKLLLMDK